jgi:hypothetical protein
MAKKFVSSDNVSETTNDEGVGIFSRQCVRTEYTVHKVNYLMDTEVSFIGRETAAA